MSTIAVNSIPFRISVPPTHCVRCVSNCQLNWVPFLFSLIRRRLRAVRFWWLMHSLHHTYGPWVMELNQQTMWQRRVSFTVTLDRWGVLESIAISGRSSMIALAGLCPVQLELSQFWHYLCSKSQFPPEDRVMCIHAFTLSLNCCRIDSWVLWAGGWAL